MNIVIDTNIENITLFGHLKEGMQTVKEVVKFFFLGKGI